MLGCAYQVEMYALYRQAYDAADVIIDAVEVCCQQQLRRIGGEYDVGVFVRVQPCRFKLKA